jgi:2-amino-4-hydroxy-6-hydroxymethyldihydropteridine diphosphokinase
MSATAYIALGSNLGDKRAFLDQALQALRATPGITVKNVSLYIETDPVGGPPGQDSYLNSAAELETDLPPRQLLEALLAIETRLGRVRNERFAPRTIDLDLLLYGEEVINEPDLIVPHPRMHERRFVLQPLSYIAAEVRHPLLGKTVREMLAERPWRAGSVSPPVASEGRGPGIPRPRSHVLAPPPKLRANTPSSAADLIRGPDALRTPGELSGQRVLVTGSTSGIGQAIAFELRAAGADVIIHGRRLHSAAGSVAWRVRWHDAQPKMILADLSEPGACEHLVDRAWEHASGIDIWINNAGADVLMGAAADWSFERKLEELLAVDLRATMLLSREVGHRMKEAGHGVIVNMGWDQAETGMEGDSGQLFGSVKGAVMAFTKSLALTLAPEVRVNCLAPGWIKTAWGESASMEWQERVVRETPLQRWGTPQDVAAAARWLVSPAAAYVTGQIIRVNGGAVR